MAERKNPLGPTYEEIDAEAIKKFNERQKANLERDAKLNRQYEWRGSKVQPMRIEPFPYERQRMDGMTDADRALRKQWLQDQHLAPNEPRYVPELYPKNPIRRLLGAPWDIFFKAVRPVIGNRMAASGRYWVPRVALAFGLVWGVHYNINYNPASWDHQHGFNVYGTRPRITPDDPSWPNGPSKTSAEFANKGFTQRSVFKDI